MLFRADSDKLFIPPKNPENSTTSTLKVSQGTPPNTLHAPSSSSNLEPVTTYGAQPPTKRKTEFEAIERPLPQQSKFHIYTKKTLKPVHRPNCLLFLLSPKLALMDPPFRLVGISV